MLVDPDSWDLVSGVEPLLERAADSEFADRLKPELMQCVLESGTVVCEDVPAAEADLRHIRAYVAEHARVDGMRLGGRRHPSVLALRESEDHRARPLPGARRDAPVRRAARARLRDARPRGGADAGGVPRGDGGRPHRAPRAARALGQLAVLARRAHRPRLDAGHDLRRVPAERAAATVRELRGLRQRRRLHGGHRGDRRLHPPVVGRPPASPLRHARGAGDGLPDARRGHDRAGRLRAVPREAPARPLPGRRAGALVPPHADGREQVARRPLRPRRPAHGPVGGQAREDAGEDARQAAPARAEAGRRELGCAEALAGIEAILEKGTGSERQEQVWNANRDVEGSRLRARSGGGGRESTRSCTPARGSRARARCRRS